MLKFFRLNCCPGSKLLLTFNTTPCDSMTLSSISFQPHSGRCNEWSPNEGGLASVPPSATREYFRTVPGVWDDSPPAACSRATHMGANWRGENLPRPVSRHRSDITDRSRPAVRHTEWSPNRGGSASIPPSATREYFRTVPGVGDDSPPAACPRATHMGVNCQDKNHPGSVSRRHIVSINQRSSLLGCLLQVSCIEGIGLITLRIAEDSLPPIVVFSVVCFVFKPRSFRQLWLQNTELVTALISSLK